MTGPEATIERKVCRKAEENLGVTNIKISSAGDTGWPDRLFILPHGRSLWIEFKSPGCTPTKKQEYIHARLRNLGHQVEVCDDENTAFDVIEKAMRKSIG